uniref:Uncharacterized protein n=1 Tax=Curvibacter symbiont subsp. Hydra magnipapillata TaxID=667019 RepID=C9YBX8_CURXX|nr:hypothetical protein Csp_C22070 [Curvibacter putative symbiont of Hydra magnipapillata]
MIPPYSRVAAIDDNDEHLKAIAWGLSQAGFCPLPFLFEDGDLASPPPEPVAGIRIIFTDIHMIGGNLDNHKVHAGIIIKCLKRIAASGPYALIFWSMFPADVEQMKKLIESDGPGAGLTTPIGYGAIDKNKVLGAGNPAEFNAQALRDLILEQMETFPTLATATQWEMRASEAAAKTTDTVFSLTQVRPAEERAKEWESLLAFLATEAVGKAIAAKNVDAALDSALLPILEDQLSFVGGGTTAQIADTHPLQVALSGSRPKRPKKISVARLNACYLVDEAGAASPKGEFERGMVIQLPGGFVNSGEFMRHFGREKSELLQKEFLCGVATPEQISMLPLHVVELGPECDHVQSKVSTHRYLLALLVPVALMELCQRESGGYHNDSVIDAGRIAFKGAPADEFHLLISTRCFMALAPGVSVGGKCKFRLRRMSIEEVVHRYTSHTRRPGVMRFNP